MTYRADTELREVHFVKTPSHTHTHTHTRSMGMWRLMCWGVKRLRRDRAASQANLSLHCGEQTHIWRLFWRVQSPWTHREAAPRSSGQPCRPPRPPSSRTPYLYEGDAARTVQCVGRVVEHSVPVQRPQPDVREEKKSRYEQPGDLQQPLLLPPHLSGRKRVKQRRWQLSSPEAPLSQAETTFTVTGGRTPALWRCAAVSSAARGREPLRFRLSGEEEEVQPTPDFNVLKEISLVSRLSP